MSATVLFEGAQHKNVLLEDYGHGEMVQANQHVIMDSDRGMILDPGGHKVYNKALSDTTHLIAPGKLDYIFCSHQDPDIVAALNGWLLTTDARALSAELWMRFIPHFGVDKLVLDRLDGIPDEGMTLTLGSCQLKILPAHFLHSCGNFQVYDPVSKILYTGDLGASLGMDYYEVPDFDAHLQYMEGFHRRYMASRSAMTAWANMVQGLDIECIAPQHGAFFRGREMVQRFIDWARDFECGLDLYLGTFKVPA